MTRYYYALLFLCLAALAGCRGRQEVQAATKAPDPISVNVAAAELRTLEKAISVTGSLNPDETVTIASEVAGKVLNIRTDFGKTVAKGEVVAEIDRT